MPEQEIILSAFREAQMSREEELTFLDLWKPISFAKHEIMTQAGEVERRFYVVITGVQSVYFIDRNGNKVVIAFSFDGSYSGVYDSFTDGAQSGYFLEALTDSQLYYIDLPSYENLFDAYTGFNRWGRLTHGELLRGRVQREIELSTLSSKERFVKFMKRCPKQLHQIPQKYLVSYLNMSPETYSRLMNSTTY